MVLIVIVFSIAMMIIANVTRISVSGQQLHAQALLKSLPVEDMTENTTQVIDSIIVEQKIEPYPMQGLSEVHLTAFNMQKEKLAEIHRIVINQ